MKQYVRVLTGTLAGWLVTAPAIAQQTPLYFGLKAGLMDADAGGFDESTNLGLVLGYDLHRDANGALSLEGEYNNTIDKGDVPGGDWKVETLGVYGAYRTAGELYLKAKAGVVREDVKVKGGSNGIAGKDTEFSYGVGAGLNIQRQSGLEFEFTAIEEDINFYSVAFFTHF
jgi:outer membrane immunogenic protein